MVVFVDGRVQNVDPWVMNPLRGPGPWPGSIKIWIGSMNLLFLLPQINKDRCYACLLALVSI